MRFPVKPREMPEKATSNPITIPLLWRPAWNGLLWVQGLPGPGKRGQTVGVCCPLEDALRIAGEWNTIHPGREEKSKTAVFLWEGISACLKQENINPEPSACSLFLFKIWKSCVDTELTSSTGQRGTKGEVSWTYGSFTHERAKGW